VFGCRSSNKSLELSDKVKKVYVKVSCREMRSDTVEPFTLSTLGRKDCGPDCPAFQRIDHSH
jgi:hypothetical protein